MPPVTSSARTSMAEALRGALADPGIRRIELAWAAGIVADWAYLIALLVVAYRAGGALGVGALGVVRMVPALVLGPLAGTPIRRLRGERALIAVHAVRAVAALLTALVLAAGGPVAATYLLAALVAGAGSLVRPIQTALLPAFAKTPGELVASNVASSTGEGVGTFIGPLIGGLILAVAGPAWACAVVAVVGVLATVVVGGIHGAEDVYGDRDRPERPTGFAPAAGLRALAAHPGAALLVADFFAQTFVRGLLITLVVVAAIGLLGLGEGGIGLLNGAMGAGGLAGGLVALGLAGRPRLALAFWGLPIAFIGGWPTALLAVGSLFVVGLSNAVLDVAGFTLLQRTVPNESRLAVFGLFEGLIGAGGALGRLPAPIPPHRFGPPGA